MWGLLCGVSNGPPFCHHSFSLFNQQSNIYSNRTEDTWIDPILMPDQAMNKQIIPALKFSQNYNNK